MSIKSDQPITPPQELVQKWSDQAELATNLSPAAQAVLDGFRAVPTLMDGPSIAGALRAAADQVVPDGPKPSANSDFHLMNWTKSLDQYYQRQQTRAELLAIAEELDSV